MHNDSCEKYEHSGLLWPCKCRRHFNAQLHYVLRITHYALRITHFCIMHYAFSFFCFCFVFGFKDGGKDRIWKGRMDDVGGVRRGCKRFGVRHAALWASGCQTSVPVFFVKCIYSGHVAHLSVTSTFLYTHSTAQLTVSVDAGMHTIVANKVYTQIKVNHV